MSKFNLFFNGRSVTNIIRDFEERFPKEGGETHVITRDGDELPPPDGVMSLPVGEFRPQYSNEHEFVLVANGGTTTQLVPILLRLERSGAAYRVLDLQRDGTTVLEERKRWETNDFPARTLSVEEAYLLYNRPSRSPRATLTRCG